MIFVSFQSVSIWIEFSVRFDRSLLPSKFSRKYHRVSTTDFIQYYWRLLGRMRNICFGVANQNSWHSETICCGRFGSHPSMTVYASVP